MVEENSLPVPPDGGWGWVIVFASHCINIVVDGVCFTYGLFLNDIQNYFEASLAKTALVGSLVPGLYLGMGPISSALANKFGVRLIGIIGSLIATIGFFLCVYSPSINWMIFFYGIIGGIGFGLLYLPAIVIVNFYFDKRRATASGLAVCGSGIGTLIFTFFTQPLLDKFSWKGSMWIISAIVLNCCVFSSLFRPLLSKRNNKKHKDDDDDDKNPSNIENYPTSFIMRKIKAQKDRDRTFSTGSMDGMLITNDNQIVKDKDFLKFKNRKLSLRESFTKNFKLSSESSERTSSITEQSAAMPLYRQDIFYTGSLHSIKEFKSQPDMKSYIASVTSLPPEADDDNNQLSKNCNSCSPIIVIAKNMFGLNLFKSATFNLVCVTAWLYMMGFFVPFAYSPSFAREVCGIKEAEYTKIPLLIMGACNTIGRIIAGWLSDQPWVNSMIFHNAALFFAGLSTIIIPFVKNFIVFNVYAAFYGFCVATFISLRSIVLVDLLGVQRLTNAFGILLLFQGIAVVFGTPIGGAIKDNTGSYTAVFMYAGATLLISSLIGILAKFVSDRENDKKKFLSTNLQEDKLYIDVIESNNNNNNDDDDDDRKMRSVPSLPKLNEML